MKVLLPFEVVPTNVVRLAAIPPGQLFREANNNDPDKTTTWMRCKYEGSAMKHGAVPVVSTIVGNVTWKDPEMKVVPVGGYLQITDWNKG